MSDIAKKTLPPGSRPGGKSGNKKPSTAADDAKSTAPRSVADSKAAESHANEDVQSDEGGDNYTHQSKAGDTAADTNLDDIQEESTTKSSKPDAEDDEEIKMQDNTSEAPSKPTEAAEESASQPETGDDDATSDGGAAASSKTSLLTEQAKRAFDRASEGQSTDEAREEFLSQGVPDRTRGDGETEKDETDRVLEEAAEKGRSAADESAPKSTAGESAQESVKTGEEETETVRGDDEAVAQGEEKSEAATQAGDEKSEAATQAGEEKSETATQAGEDAKSTAAPPSEDKSQQQQQEVEESQPAETEAGDDDVDSKTAEGISVHDAATTKTGDTATQAAPETEAGTAETAPEEGTVTDETEGTATEGQGTAQEETATESGETATQQEGTQGPQDSVTVPEMLDFSVLKGGKVNKGGNVVDDGGKVVGRVVEGILQYLVGKRVDENGDIWADNGKVIGKAEPITESERDDMMKEAGPFESFPDAVVDGKGMVVSNGEWVGKVVEGDVKQLRGKAVDADGDILDKGGNLIGKAERWEPEEEAEPEPEAEVDNSLLAGKRVNKAGNVVDSNGTIFGRVVEGDVKKMVGRMCDKKGNILSESGDILGKAELVSEGEREGSKDGPFAELSGCTVAKDGTIVTPSGDVVGRLVSGDAKVLFGRAVDEDGDILDKNGNSIGKAERWEPEQVEKKKGPMAGRRVNKEGNVVDEDGNVIGKLTSGDPSICSGKEIDDDGDVVDGKGTVVGHCSLIGDIKEEEETSPEEKEKLEKAEQDRKLAIQMSVCIEQCLDKIRPICKMITEVRDRSPNRDRRTELTMNQKIDKAERTPEDERDEEALVREVKPLIEEGGRILEEAKGIIKGLDPDGRISANAKHKTAAREATPEEYHLADVLKDLTGDVTKCIETNKKKLEDMPHAKKELNPLWGLLNEPLFQILAAVGLLLSGVLGLVGRLVSFSVS